MKNFFKPHFKCDLNSELKKFKKTEIFNIILNFKDNKKTDYRFGIRKKNKSQQRIGHDAILSFPMRSHRE